MFKNKAQVWVETVIYISIGLTMIAILFSAAKPQIEKIKDKGIIKQTADALTILDEKLLEIAQASGNIRIVNFKIARGKLEIDSERDLIRYYLENTRLELSETGEEIKEGNIFLKTEKYGSRFIISLTMNYTDSLNITFQGKNESRTLHAGSIPHKIRIENIGDNAPDENTHIDFDLI